MVGYYAVLLIFFVRFFESDREKKVEKSEKLTYNNATVGDVRNNIKDMQR